MMREDLSNAISQPANLTIRNMRGGYTLFFFFLSFTAQRVFVSCILGLDCIYNTLLDTSSRRFQCYQAIYFTHLQYLCHLPPLSIFVLMTLDPTNLCLFFAWTPWCIEFVCVRDVWMYGCICMYVFWCGKLGWKGSVLGGCPGRLKSVAIFM